MQLIGSRAFAVWVVALILWIALASGTAAAFECMGAKLPSSVVICSDPELMRLADERQETINEARGRIGEERWPELWEDQKAWVKSYAAACGVSPNLPPPIPVPASIRECFKRAAEARIAYIRGYGRGIAGNPVSPGVAAVDRIGPGFDCSNAVHPLALLICADVDLSRVDLRFNQAYWSLFQQLGAPGQTELKKEDIQFIDQVQEQCGVPRSGPLTEETWRARDCVKDAYEKMRAAWIARLTGQAREEAVRPLERHLVLQRTLQQLGFVPAGPIDGEYARSTRIGIAAWQSAHGLPATGLLGDTDARTIEQEVTKNQALAEPGRELPRPEQRPLSRGPAITSRDEVPLKKSGRIYAVPVRINDAITLDFVVDSGASDVLVPADVVLTLVRTGTLADSDFKGKQTYTLADGSELKSAQFILRELRVADYILSNVIASVGPVEGGLLLGQSFLSRFDSWALDNNRHVLVLGQALQ